MDLKINSLYRYCVQAAFLLMAACASSPHRDTVVDSESATGSNYYLGKDAVYATLKSGSGGSWIFDKVTQSDSPVESAFLVRLNDLAPAFDTRVAECTPQAYPTNHKCNPAHPFRNKDVGVLGKIINGGIAAGTAGKVTDVSRTYETSFDETTFNQAVDEALVNSGLDRERQNLLEALATYETLLQTSRAKLDGLKRGSEAEYRDTSSIKLDIQPRISGLTEYYTNDLDFRDLIELSPRMADIPDAVNIQAEQLLPCDAGLCARKANTAIATVRAELEKSTTRLQADTSYVYDVRCERKSHKGYLLQMDCPDQITRAPVGPVPLPVSLKILARDFDNLFPNIVLQDDHLSVAIDTRKVSFTNKTSDYLSLSAETIYYNSKVQTNGIVISLAPGAVVSRSIDEFASPAIAVESSYLQMTPDKAASSTFDFGFAVKYSGAGDVAETTLYDKREFNVACVIDNRIRPGSCSESLVPEMHANKKTSAPF